jgi:acetylcholinesterase
LVVIRLALLCMYYLYGCAHITYATFLSYSWGQSAGSMSILAQMLAFGGRDEGLFRAGFMMSGYSQALLTADQAQTSYDQLVNFTNCSTPMALSTYNGSSLECLRNVSFTTLGQAVGNLTGILSYAGLNLTFGPRVEGPGGFLQDTFRQGVAKGKYVRVPLVAGECADEGT